MADLSVLIPARNEMFLSRTVQDILEHATSDVEIVAVLDGAWADPAIPQNPKVHVIYHPESIGQRAATNEAARIATSPYLMKVDAHCAFAPGFDTTLLADMRDDWTMVPTMKNLHAFDWVCPEGHRRYQGPSGPCKDCGKETTRDILWRAKPSPNSNSYCFDSTPHFQYFKEFERRPEGRGDLTPTMSLQGSCFLVKRQRYFDLNLCDESFGSWGSQGIEVAVKSWLSGGRVVVNHKTWYAHMFRTQGGDFGFPYPQSQQQVEFAKSTARDLFFSGKWDKAVHPLSWLVRKFWPVPGWTEDDLAKLEPTPATRVEVPTPEPVKIQIAPRKSGLTITAQPALSKGLVYYTDNRLDGTRLGDAVKTQLKRCANGHEIVSASLHPIDFGKNTVLPLERGALTMFKQILAGLEASTADIIFLTEHDILYSPSHFDFVPPRRDVFYYNTNVWKLRIDDGFAVRVDFCQQTSGLCAYRDLLLEHYRKRVERVEKDGYDRHIGFEPGTHAFPRGIDNYGAESWESEYPNIDVRHDKNLTPNRWSPSQFRNPKYAKGWTETTGEFPGWGSIQEILRSIRA